MDDCPHKTLKRQIVGNQHWYACGVDARVAELASALEVIRKCLQASAGQIGEYWSARKWLRDHGRYEGNLQELAVPLEVCDVALLELEASGSVCGQKFLCEPWDGKMKVEKIGEH